MTTVYLSFAIKFTDIQRSTISSLQHMIHKVANWDKLYFEHLPQHVQ